MNVSSQRSVVSPAVMIDGCLSALERLLEATKDPQGGPDTVFVPLFEAGNWAASIDLFFEDQGKPIGDPTLRAVRFARNRSHHQWAQALRRNDWPGVGPMMPGGPGARGGGMVIRTGPPPGFWWAWVELAELPAGRPDPYGEAAYASELAGKPAEPTLQALRPVLEALR